MKKLIDATADEAVDYFLQGSSYFSNDLPPYINFKNILNDVYDAYTHSSGYQEKEAHNLQGVNYSLIANKDGKFSWRPYEFIHPVIYASLIDLLCEKSNWAYITKKMKNFESGIVECCGSIVMSEDHESDPATQVKKWWNAFEQRSITLSLEYSHILHTDITDCYGSLYTHSIAWALHGIKEAKKRKNDRTLLGNEIDFWIRAGRYGQTNGISQGSVLMDFIAELVLGYVDNQITDLLDGKREQDFKILRYRDDYRIFTNDDSQAGEVLKILSDCLRNVGMRLSVEKTFTSTNVVKSSIKPDKLAGINLQDLGKANAKTFQKRLLRLHAFGIEFPNSGALRRLLTELAEEVKMMKRSLKDIDVQVAILTDIATISPRTIPTVAAILSRLLSRLRTIKESRQLWEKIITKMERVPNNGYLDIWLQRVTIPAPIGLIYPDSENAICKIVNMYGSSGKEVKLWSNDWIQSNDLKEALNASKIVITDPRDINQIVQPEEYKLFRRNAWEYW